MTLKNGSETELSAEDRSASVDVNAPGIAVVDMGQRLQMRLADSKNAVWRPPPYSNDTAAYTSAIEV